MRDAVTNGGNALPKNDEPDVTRFRSAAAKRVQAHRARARMGLRRLTVRISDRQADELAKVIEAQEIEPDAQGLGKG